MVEFESQQHYHQKPICLFVSFSLPHSLSFDSTVTGIVEQVVELQSSNLLLTVFLWGSHGTRCAGEVSAARDNQVCGVGVAYDSKVAGK